MNRVAVGVLCLLATLVVCSGWAAANEAAVNPALERVKAEFPGAWTQYDGDKLQRIYAYSAPFGYGDTPEQTAARFVQDYAAAVGADTDDLFPVSFLEDARATQPVMYDAQTGTYKFTLVYYTQWRDGVPVFRSDLRLLVKNEPGYPLVLASTNLQDLGSYRVPMAALSSPRVDLGETSVAAAYPQMVNFGVPETVIWAGYDQVRADPTLALTFVADNGLAGTTDYQKRLFVTDAQTGKILYDENMILSVDVTGNVSGKASPDYRADACITELVTPMPYARVSIGTTVAYADANGNFVIPNSGSSSVTVVSTVRGRYFDVNNQSSSDASLSVVVTPPGPANFVHNSGNAEYTTAEVNGYIQANVVRDMALTANPSYPTIGTQYDWPVNVNIADTCNAYYDYSSINFYRSGGGCNNTAFGDVIHHEYGHHLVNVGGSGQDAYGEGMADSVALNITGRSQMGIGFESCSTGIRNANNTIQYPCSGEIHYCGQLLSGCVWDMRTQLMLGNPSQGAAIARDLTVNSILLHSGGSITPTITTDFLTLDDDDSNLSNGTPHWAAICTGFGNHNMDCPALATIGFTYPYGRPTMLDPSVPTQIQVVVVPLAGTPQQNTGKMYYRLNGGSWVETNMTQTSANNYIATLPAASCYANYDYYFSARDTLNNLVKDPSDAPTSYFSAVVATGQSIFFEDDFQTNKGWTVTAGATLGNWERADPEPVVYEGSNYSQPGDDHTPAPGTLCYVTGPLAGSGAGSYDVD
ncbi:MAG TPA: hypothetical protein PKK06_18515, partial [Phycisphaerae bacterium]|nr:hypothetical protein [Phycisphaerae bacterium]HNU47177.1 hypothetical protein [Phycisphaerae bacterium]